MYLIDTVIMKEKIKNLVEDFRKIEAMPKADNQERDEREKHLESWFKSAQQANIKSEVGVSITTDSVKIHGIKYRYFTFVDVFDDINIFITAQFGGKQKLHEVRSLIHLPD